MTIFDMRLLLQKPSDNAIANVFGQAVKGKNRRRIC